MDAATQMKLMALVFMVLLPAAAVLGISFVGARVSRGHTRWARALGSAAVMGGLVVSYLGLSPGWPGDLVWVLYAGGLGGVWGLLLDLTGPRRRWCLAGLGAIGVSLVVIYAVTASLPGLWQPGPRLPQLARLSWGVEVAAWSAVVWIGVDRALDRSAPAALAAMSIVALAGAGHAILSGSALLGQISASMGVVAAVAGLVAWRWPERTVGHGAAGALMAGISALLAFDQHLVDVALPGAQLVLMSPLLALAATHERIRSTWARVGLAVALAGGVAGAGVYLAQVSLDADEAATAAEDDSPDYGSMY